MNNDVLPTFEAHGAVITTVLSDNGRDFPGREDRHPYEGFLQLEGIEYRTTQVKRPQSNGFVLVPGPGAAKGTGRSLSHRRCRRRMGRSAARSRSPSASHHRQGRQAHDHPCRCKVYAEGVESEALARAVAFQEHPYERMLMGRRPDFV